MRPVAATFIPLCSAVGYACAALMLKRAMDSEERPWRVVFLVNVLTAVLFQFWLLRGGADFTGPQVLRAALAGLCFFIGQVFTFLALRRGDVSLATPVLGMKVVFVALLSSVAGGEVLGARTWAAALLTAVALVLLGGEGGADRRRVVASVGYAFLAALAFAATDVLQQLWAPASGFGHFAPVMFATVGLLSLGLIPFFGAPLRDLPVQVRRWAGAGGLLLGVQAMGVAYCIALYHEVTVTNVLYNTRGLWSIALVWMVGHWFANDERRAGDAVMARRLVGALFMLAAVWLSLG